MVGRGTEASCFVGCKVSEGFLSFFLKILSRFGVKLDTSSVPVSAFGGIMLDTT